MIKQKYIKQIKTAVIACFVCAIAYVMGFIILSGTNAQTNFASVFFFTVFIVLGSGSKKIFWLILFPIILLHALYIPFGIMYGQLHYSFLIAGAAADISEFKEFIQLVELSSVFYSITLIILTVLLRFLIVRYQIKLYKSQLFVFISVAFVLFIFLPNSIVQQIFGALDEWNKEYERIEKIREKNDWEQVAIKDQQYDTYVLIIGESARRDYHHAYGYPIENTPFMSSAKGMLISGLTSGGNASVVSLRLMLTLAQQSNWAARYNLNIIDLAKSAGMKIYWLSNSGYIGEHDTPITAIAKSSDVIEFLKTGSANSKNTSDFELLPMLSNILNEDDEKQPKLIILHIYGSHPDPCRRIKDYYLISDIEDTYYSTMNCYISSIHKTDKFLENVYQLLQEKLISKGETFSMLYFSDHGLTHYETYDQVKLTHSKLVGKYHYQIPLFKISSDDNQRIECNSFKSGLNFTNGLANWMSIKAKQLEENYSLFDCQSDPDDFGLSKKFDNTIDDAAIDLRDK